nr:hypothetical protein [Brevundimonas diminuta]
MRWFRWILLLLSSIASALAIYKITFIYDEGVLKADAATVHGSGIVELHQIKRGIFMTVLSRGEVVSFQCVPGEANYFCIDSLVYLGLSDGGVIDYSFYETSAYKGDRRKILLSVSKDEVELVSRDERLLSIERTYAVKAWIFSISWFFVVVAFGAVLFSRFSGLARK